MLGVTIFMAICACVASTHLVYTPPYIQAKTSFARVKLYLQQNIPYDVNDIHNKDFRRHFGYGVITAVTAALVDSYRMNPSIYDPLDVFFETVPEVWDKYNEMASGPVNRILAEAAAKILPITNLAIVCNPTDSIDECNRIIESKVESGPSFMRNRANLLLQLGKLSDIVISKAAQLDSVVARDQSIPYLLNNVDTNDTLSLVQELAYAYDLLRNMGPTQHV